MKCVICNQKTTYDVSYGADSFIVCPTCFKKIKKITKESSANTIEFILAIGRIKEELKEND